MTPHIRAFANAIIFLLLLGASAAAAAQSLPRPAEFYFDDDARVARPLVAIEGDDESTTAQLARLMDRGGRNAMQATSQLARLAMASGRVDTGRALYARALAMAGASSVERRSLHWNQGWDLYRVGDVDGALAQWTEALANRATVYPSWAPPTLAIALWQLDRRQEAVAWYAAAVRTWPDRWSNPAALPGLLPDWREAERATLAEVLAAWQQDPPAWP